MAVIKNVKRKWFRKKVITTRIIYEAKCPTCDFDDIRTENPPRETRCPNCKTWIDFKEVSWSGQDSFKKK